MLSGHSHGNSVADRIHRTIPSAPPRVTVRGASSSPSSRRTRGRNQDADANGTWCAGGEVLRRVGSMITPPSLPATVHRLLPFELENLGEDGRRDPFQFLCLFESPNSLRSCSSPHSSSVIIISSHPVVDFSPVRGTFSPLVSPPSSSRISSPLPPALSPLSGEDSDAVQWQSAQVSVVMMTVPKSRTIRKRSRKEIRSVSLEKELALPEKKYPHLCACAVVYEPPPQAGANMPLVDDPRLISEANDCVYVATMYPNTTFQKQDEEK
ncbi:hypothetical protein QAD02_017106 [Eretmocerus hayati]|uniref:Uncharacterized protein n=1 Tax=Eretmocerus hayati TaxID=131215 RepID=A0ACC2PFF8_9HYME|nr:hypothetical protein QAD02_017106 [Eretmocerus hayati]